MNKQALRKYYKEQRASLDETNVTDLSLAIANQALKLPIWEHTNYHIFLSIESKKEVDTSYLLHILQGRDKTIIVSKSNFETHTLQHILLQENTRIQISEYGIPEPEDGIEVPVTSIDVVFVPLLVFDQKGNRIGYGKGFYDRFLQQCKAGTIFIGLSFFEVEEEIPNDAFDVALHYCVTPQKIHTF